MRFIEAKSIGIGRRSLATITSSGGALFAPVLAMFDGGENGDIWLPSDLSTLFQDTDGNTPVTTNGDLVGRNDGQIHGASWRLIQGGVDSAKPVYNTDGTYHWLSGDGLSDHLVSASALAATDGSGHHFSGAAVRFTADPAAAGGILSADQITSTRISQMLRAANGFIPQSVALNTVPAGFADAPGTNASLNEDFVITQITASNAVECFKNGTGNGATTITGTMKTGSTILSMFCNLTGAGGTPANRMTGRIYGAFHLSRAPTAQEHSDAVAWLQSLHP